MFANPFLTEEITETIADRAPEDFYFRTSNGYTIKVKLFALELHPGERDSGMVDKLGLSGAICTAEGKALLRHDGSLAVHNLGQTFLFSSHADADYAAHLAQAMMLCVAATVRAEKILDVTRGYAEGQRPLVTLQEYASRKAREAAEAAPASSSN